MNPGTVAATWANPLAVPVPARPRTPLPFSRDHAHRVLRAADARLQNAGYLPLEGPAVHAEIRERQAAMSTEDLQRLLHRSRAPLPRRLGAVPVYHQPWDRRGMVGMYLLATRPLLTGRMMRRIAFATILETRVPGGDLANARLIASALLRSRRVPGDVRLWLAGQPTLHPLLPQLLIADRVTLEDLIAALKAGESPLATPEGAVLREVLDDLSDDPGWPVMLRLAPTWHGPLAQLLPTAAGIAAE